MAVGALEAGLLAEYRIANTGAIVVRRSDRGLVRVWGRDPVRMIHNMVSADVERVGPDGAAYATLLTPKGRMLADLRVIRRADDVLIEADLAALENVRDQLKRSVPPLFARSEDVSDRLGVVGIYGPSARAALSGVLDPQGLATEGDAAGTAVELSDVAVDASIGGAFRGDPVIAVRTDYAGVDGWDVIVPAGTDRGLRQALEGAGAEPAGLAVLEILRIEAGRPRWGAELDEDVIPLEAGLGDRAISTTKGCYTGQEVIVRILHRGHVNRHLRGLLLGDSPTGPGTVLYTAGGTKPAGTITSVCSSPAFGQFLALGYVRREVEPGEVLRAGAKDGAEARVVQLPFPDRPSQPSA